MCPQAGGTKIPLLGANHWDMAGGPCRSVIILHTLAQQTKPLSGFIDISVTGPRWFMDNHYYIPCCKGAFCFPKRRDTGTLPKAQAVPTGPHSTLSPKTAPKPGRWPHLRVLCGCWIAGAWLGGHGFGSFLNLGVRHCPPKPLNRAFKFFFKAPSISCKN